MTLNTNTIGFDLFSDFFNTSKVTYPPYNIIKYSNKDYSIELAVAGFSQEEIDVNVEDRYLVITGKKPEQSNEGFRILHQGLAKRSFFQKFLLEKEIEVKSAELQDGILTIKLEKFIPEAKQPKKIAIEHKH
jgi:molecular chaperone IbpA